MTNYDHRRPHSPRTRIATYLLSLMFALGSSIGSAQSNDDETPELAGRVIVVSGSAIARGPNGDRSLSRREAIYVGDTIFTDAQASMQIRMVDDALIALHESTEFAIVAYQYEQDVSSDESTIELIQGGFRTITGSIGQQNRAAYEANIADFATIGIRGTDYEAVITANGVFTGVYDGGTTVSNPAGTLNLGVDANFDFAQIATPNSPPIGLLLQPPGLGNSPFTAAVDDEEEEAADEGESQDDSADNDDSGDSDTSDEEAVDGQSSDDNGQPAVADNDRGGNGNDVSLPIDAIQEIANTSPSGSGDTQEEPSTAALSLETPSTELAVAAFETSTTSAISRNNQEDTTSTVNVNPSETSTGGSLSCATDSNLYLQLVDGQVIGEDESSSADDTGTDTTDSGDSSVSDDEASNDSTDVTGDDTNNGNGNGNSGSGNSGNNGNGNGNTNSGSDNETTTTNIVTNDDGSTTTTTSGNGNSGNNGNGNSSGNGQTLQKPALTVDTQGISWGKWNNAVDENFVVISQIDNDFVLVATSDYLAQVNPAPIGKLTGSHNYATTISSSFIGNGSAGDISSLIASMSVNFETGVIDQGSLDVLVADQAWAIEFGGSVHNGVVDLNAINGQLLDSTGLISNSIDANLGGVFSGNTGSAFVGGFDLIDEMNTYNTVNGLFTIER